MAIKEASNELYKSLRHTEGVLGTGVVCDNSKSHIVVFLKKKTQEILNQIPHTYKGNAVKVQLSKPFFGL